MALLEGEGHFEIAKIPSRPFKLYVRNMEVEVKGTTFDISAYKNDSLVRTTLIEGKVTLKSGDDTLSLRPGEQAIWAPGKKMKKITVNSVEASARSQGWKENKFKWEKAELRTILGDIAHWHGYNLSYKTNLPSGTYYFCFDRTETLQEIFKTIQTGTRLKFKLDSATIIIYR
jgi:ferric-dicitrate binding protein FerR (iron transport regulator)